MKSSLFKSLIWNYYHQYKRDLLWRPPQLKPNKRDTLDPYKVVVSEVMLQQTQVSRVIEKFPSFIEKFPSFKSLSSATLKEVLAAWQGMGYNRRGKYLHEIANIMTKKYHGVVPQDPEELQKLPGIGPATAGSIIVFIYNKPLIFIETNIRRVFIHHFFKDVCDIDDKEILPLINKTLDQSNPREWYYALMDYGSFLAKQVLNPNRKSKHYTKQSKFEGSNRQIRARVLQWLLEKNNQTMQELYQSLDVDHKRIDMVVKDMEQEGILQDKKGKYGIYD